MGFTNYIKQIKDTQSTPVTYDLVDTSASHYVKGTQTASTNLWTGALPDGVTEYYDGLSIDYFLPYAGTSTAATLNLGNLGPKPVYVGNGTGGVTTHYPVNSVIHLTYIVNSNLNSGSGCWKATGYYNTNDDYRVRTVQRGTTKAYVLATTTAPTASNQNVTSVSETGVYLETSDSVTRLVAPTFVGALTGTASGNLTSDSTLDASKLSGTIPTSCYTNSNTTYTLTNALASHQFTWTFTAGGSGSGSTTTAAQFAAGTGITLTDDTTNKKITIGCSVTNTNTTYTLSNALASHKFTETLTAGGSGSGTSTATMEFVAGTGITLTDDTTNKKITIGCSVTNTDEKVKTNAITLGTTYQLVLGTSTSSAETKYYDSGKLTYSSNTVNTMTSSKLTVGGAGGNNYGQLELTGASANTSVILQAAAAINAVRTINLPNASGTLALNTVVVAGASPTSGGLMSQADKTKLDGMTGGVIVSATEPTGVNNHIWIDTTNNNIAKFWDGTNWTPVGSVWS